MKGQMGSEDMLMLSAKDLFGVIGIMELHTQTWQKVDGELAKQRFDSLVLNS
jgi:hypothetical protein